MPLFLCDFNKNVLQIYAHYPTLYLFMDFNKDLLMNGVSLIIEEIFMRTMETPG